MSKASVDFSMWLSKRQRDICENHITDENGRRIKIADAPASALLEASRSLAAHNKLLEANHFVVTSAAEKQAKADPSDPFTYARVKSHLLSGLCSRDDYSVDFIKEKRSYRDAAGNDIEYNHLIPTRVRHP